MKKRFWLLLLVMMTCWSDGSAAGKITDALFEQARVSVLERDYEEAREIYRMIIGFPGADMNERAKARQGIGETYREEIRFPEAAESFRTVISDYPDADPDILAAVRESLARVYLRTGEYERAIRECRKALLDRPGEDAEARIAVDIGEAHLLNKEYLQAKACLEEALGDYPDLDADTAAKCGQLLNLVYRKEKKRTKFILDKYEKIPVAYPSADLATLSDVLYQEAKFYEYHEFGWQAFEVFRKEWIFSTTESNRNLRTIWVLGNHLLNEGGPARAAAFVDYLQYGSAGADRALGTDDDLVNPLSTLEKYTVEACGAQHWPENLARHGKFPPPPAVIGDWTVLRDYFQDCFRKLDDSDWEGAQRVGDYITSCGKADEGNTLGAEEFFRREENLCGGLKKAAIRNILFELRRQNRLVKVYSMVLREFNPLLSFRGWIVKTFTGAGENEFLARNAKHLLGEWRPKEARRLYEVLVEMPLVDVEDTVAGAAAGLINSFPADDPGKAGLEDYWKKVLAGRKDSAPEETGAVLRGIIRALRKTGQAEKAEVLCRYLLENDQGGAAAGAAAGEIMKSLAAEGKFTEAIAVGEKQLAGTPAAPVRVPILEKLAPLYEQAGEPMKAAAAYREAAQDAGEEEIKAGFLRQAAQLAQRNGDGEGALTAWKQAVESFLRADTLEGLGALAESAGAAMELKKPGEAIKFYRQAAALLAGEDFPTGEENLSVVGEEELSARAGFWKDWLDYLEAKGGRELPGFNPVIANYPHSFEAGLAHCLLARRWFDQRDPAEAEKHVRFARQAFPDDRGVQELSRLIMEAAGKSKKAAMEISVLEVRRAKESRVGQAEIRFRLGELRREKGDYAEAIGEWRRIVTDFPESPFAVRALAQIASASGEFPGNREKMEETYGELICLYPETETAGAALEYLVRAGKEDRIGSTVLVGETTDSGADYAKLEADYAAGDYEKVVREGMRAFRTLIRERPGLRLMSRRIAAMAEAERKVLAGLKPGAGKTGQEESPLIFHDLMELLPGGNGSPETGMSDGEKRFLELFEDSLRKRAVAELSEAWKGFSAGAPSETKLLPAAEKTLACLLLGDKEEEAWCRLQGIVPGTLLRVPVRLDLARYCVGIGKIELAGRMYVQAAEQADTETGKIAVLKELAEFYEDAGRMTDAVDTLRKIADGFPGLSEAAAARLQIGGLLAGYLNDHGAAEREYRELVEKFPGSPEAVEARFLLGELARGKKKYQKAIEELEALVRDYPGNEKTIEAGILIARCYQDRGDTGTAVEKLRLLIREHPDHDLAARAQFLIGDFYSAASEKEKSTVEYQKVIDNYPGSPYRYEAQGLLYRRNVGDVPMPEPAED